MIKTVVIIEIKINLLENNKILLVYFEFLFIYLYLSENYVCDHVIQTRRSQNKRAREYSVLNNRNKVYLSINVSKILTGTFF